MGILLDLVFIEKLFPRPLSCLCIVGAHPGGGTPLQGPNGDVPLDGVAFSQLE